MNNKIGTWAGAWLAVVGLVFFAAAGPASALSEVQFCANKSGALKVRRDCLGAGLTDLNIRVTAPTPRFESVERTAAPAPAEAPISLDGRAVDSEGGEIDGNY